MNGSTLRRLAVLLAGLCAAPFALAQEAAGQEPHWGFITAIALGAMVIPIAIVAIVNINEYRQNRERLATIAQIAAAGQLVPPELLLRAAPPPTLPEERRRDVRRGITLLCWAVAVALVFYLTSGGQLRAASWGLLFLILSLGSFLKAWLTAREIARGAAGAR